MLSIKNNLLRANTTRVMFYLLLTISIVLFYALYVQYEILINAKNGKGISHEAALDNQMRMVVISVINVVLLVASMITFLMWIYRAYENLTNLNITSLNFTPGWAVGNWFIPILSLYKPYTVVREIWEETQDYTLPADQKQNITKPTLVGIWWAIYLINIFFSYFALLIFKGDTSIDGLLALTIALMVSNTVTIIAKVVTLIMINRIVIYEKNLLDFVENTNNAQFSSMNPPAI